MSEVKGIKTTVEKDTTNKKAEAPVKKAPVKKAEPAVKAAVKKEAPVKKEAVKKETVVKETVKKSTPSVKKTAAAVKKEEAVIFVQFGSKSYTQDDFARIAKDVWVYDLARKAEDFKNVEIYVKPEESMAYFVVNGEESGSFLI